MIDLTSPLMQQIVAQGQANGYSPMAIGAIASRALAENGGDTSGTPGDDGTAFGGMQWRGSRFTALKNLADQMGSTWDDPKVQAAHIYNELGGTEKQSGQALMYADNPQSATNAIMGYVRPGGYSASNPQNGNGYAKTLNGTDAIADAISNGQTSVNIPGTPAPPTPSSAQPPSTSGATASSNLSSSPPTANLSPTFGNRLLGLASALMARDNPQGAAAMRGLQQDQQQQQILSSGLGQWEDKGDTPSGTGRVLVNKYTGQNLVSPLPVQFQTRDKPAEEKAYRDNDQQAQTNGNTIDQLNQVRSAILNGKLSLSWDNQAKNFIANTMNSSNEESLNNKDAVAALGQAVNNSIANMKGPATQNHFNAALAAIAPAGASSDDAAMLDVLGRAIKAGRSQYDPSARFMMQMLNKHPDLAPGTVDASGNVQDAPGVVRALQDRMNGWDQNEATISPQIDAFKKAHFAKSAGGGSGSSFYNFQKSFNSQ